MARTPSHPDRILSHFVIAMICLPLTLMAWNPSLAKTWPNRPEAEEAKTQKTLCPWFTNERLLEAERGGFALATFASHVRNVTLQRNPRHLL
jgi:hypothetical protein